jgi:RNA polymerase sigma-70 factor (ECF subfamily)
VDDGFERLYREEFPVVFKTAFLLCGDPDIAEDATQHAFAKALDRWSHVKAYDRPGAWVTVTALNHVRRRLRVPSLARRARYDAELVTGGVSPEDRILLWEGVRSLPRRQREAVVLFYVAGLSVEEVSRAMGCENGTVKAHLSKARHHLAEHIEAPD